MTPSYPLNNIRRSHLNKNTKGSPLLARHVLSLFLSLRYGSHLCRSRLVFQKQVVMGATQKIADIGNCGTLNILIEGCCHGELDQIYSSAHMISEEKGVNIDMIIICGDFQSVRNEQDLTCLACPPKYREMNTFYKYYSGTENKLVDFLMSKSHLYR